MTAQFTSFALIAAPLFLPPSVADRTWRAAIRTTAVVLLACAFLGSFVAAVIYCFITGQVGSPM